jgi:hypothetical protein
MLDNTSEVAFKQLAIRFLITLSLFLSLKMSLIIIFIHIWQVKSLHIQQLQLNDVLSSFEKFEFEHCSSFLKDSAVLSRPIECDILVFHVIQSIFVHLLCDKISSLNNAPNDRKWPVENFGGNLIIQIGSASALYT